MKKIFFGIIAVVVIAAVAGYNVYTSLDKGVEFSNLALENVEALTRAELTPEGWSCFKHYYDDTSSSIYFVIVRCDNCYSDTATWAFDPDHCWYTH